MLKIVFVSLITLLSVWAADRINYAVAGARLGSTGDAAAAMGPGKPSE